MEVWEDNMAAPDEMPKMGRSMDSVHRLLISPRIA